MAVLELKHNGVCQGGPWHGQRLEAEFATVTPMLRLSLRPGFYLWRDGAWIWTEPSALLRGGG